LESKNLESMIRVLRQAKELNLSSVTEEILTQRIHKPVDEGNSGRMQMVASQLLRNGTNEPGMIPDSKSEVKSSAELSDLAQAEMRIRQALDNDADWHKVVAPLLNKLARLDRQGIHTNQILEWTVMYGDSNEVCRLVQILLRSDSLDYEGMHLKIREILVAKLWAINADTQIRCLVQLVKDQNNYTAVEHYFIVYDLFMQRFYSRSLNHYQLYWEKISTAAKYFQDYIGVHGDRLWIILCQSAAELGFFQLARRFLNHIPNQSSQYQEVPQWIEKLAVIKTERGQHTQLGEQIKREPLWRDKLRKIDEILCRIEIQDDPDFVAEANLLFEDVLQFVPQSAKAYGEVSKLILKHLHLHCVTPSILRLFADNVLVFFPPAFELCLWEPALVDENYSNISANPSLNRYLRAIAYIHRFIATEADQIGLLWKARGEYSKVAKSELPYQVRMVEWAEIQQAVLQWVNIQKFGHLKMLELQNSLKMMANISTTSEEEITRQVLWKMREFPEVYQLVADIAQQRSSLSLELAALDSISEPYHLSNEVVTRKKDIAKGLNRPDLYWRSVTVMNLRGIEQRSQEGAWQISGENRLDYPILDPTLDHVGNLLDFLGEKTQKMSVNLMIAMQALRSMAPMFLTTAKVQTDRRWASAKKQTATELAQQVPWLFKKHDVIVSDQMTFIDDYCYLPEFFDAASNNQWSQIFFRVAEAMGIAAVNWSLKDFAQLLTSVAHPTLGIYKEAENLKKIQQLSDLSQTQRHAIQVCSRQVPLLNEQEFRDICTIMVMTTALAIYPAHGQALESLKLMSHDFKLKRILELLILSDQYGHYRRVKGIGASLEITL
jgi:hypothetical protein